MKCSEAAAALSHSKATYAVGIFIVDYISKVALAEKNRCPDRLKSKIYTETIG